MDIWSFMSKPERQVFAPTVDIGRLQSAAAVITATAVVAVFVNAAAAADTVRAKTPNIHLLQLPGVGHVEKILFAGGITA